MKLQPTDMGMNSKFLVNEKIEKLEQNYLDSQIIHEPLRSRPSLLGYIRESVSSRVKLVASKIQPIFSKRKIKI